MPSILSRIMILMLVMSSCIAGAKTFRNAYVSFELPESWNCVLEHTEWVCRSGSDKESKESIIILTAKEVGPTDSLVSYTQHLATAQQSAFKVGTTSLSQVTMPPKQVRINDHIWIDGLHLGSEIPNYYTRYLATVKDKIAVLVTMSAHKTVYPRYSQDFFKAIQSLRVIATGQLLGRSDSGPLRPSSESLGSAIGAAVPSDMAGTEVFDETGGESGQQSSKTKSLIGALAFILAALGAYLWIKSRKS